MIRYFQFNRATDVSKVVNSLRALSTCKKLRKLPVEDICLTIAEYKKIVFAVQKYKGSLGDADRKSYSKFWALGSIRPSIDFRKNYFDILARVCITKEFNLKYVMEELRPFARNAYVFSHTSKLFHSADPHLPIVDSKIINFFQFPAVPYGAVLDRGGWYADLYGHIQDVYSTLELNDTVGAYLNKFERVVPAFSGITFNKKLDSIITDVL